MSNVNFLPKTKDPLDPKEGKVAFEPHWRTKIGPLIQEGRGILTNPVFVNINFIEEFTLIFPGVSIKLDLKTGCIWHLPYSATPKIAYNPELPPGTKFKLIWFRRMTKEMATHDHNTGAFETKFYGFGWETTVNNKKIKFGYTVKQEVGKPEEAEFIEGLPQ